jgi:uncharacterized membrane protein
MIKPLARSVSIGNAFNKGLQLYKENFLLIFLASLLAGLIGGFSCGICLGPMQCGLIGICLTLLRGQEPKPQVGDVFKGFQKFVPAFVTMLVLGLGFFVINLILGLIPIVGWLAALVIAYFISPAVSAWAMFLIQDQNATIGEAITTPFKMMGDGKFWMIMLIIFLAGLLGAVGLIACIIGVFFTMPFAMCMTAAAYQEAYDDDSDQADDAPAQEPVELPQL